ncbi:unnamed protein product [marine sediment metagenome]|uniref:Uncharacterized protein n=1 Tax=marine sediment metagenome TaxID=412755 RepID=X0TM69_9ZZZZ
MIIEIACGIILALVIVSIFGTALRTKFDVEVILVNSARVLWVCMVLLALAIYIGKNVPGPG